MNFARLNHILIPKTNADRERFRRSWVGRAMVPLSWLVSALSREGRALFVITILVGIAGLETTYSRVYLLWSVLLGTFFASFAMRPFFRLTRVALAVNHPPRVARGRALTFELELTNSGSAAVHDLRVDGPFLPWDGRWLSQRRTLTEVKPNEVGRTSRDARFVERGEHILDPFYVSAVIPLGLTVGPSETSSPVRFLVVPRVANVQQLSLPDSAAQRNRGDFQNNHRGLTDEILGLRPYRAGDPLRSLHIPTWARTGQTHVREYVSESLPRVGIWIDPYAASKWEEEFEALLSLAAGLVRKAHENGWRLGALVVGNEVLSIDPSGPPLLQALDHLALVKQKTGAPAQSFTQAERALAGLDMLYVLNVGPSEEAKRARAVAAQTGYGPGQIRHLRVPFGKGPDDGPGSAIPRALIEAAEPLQI